jgi:hypothetical protein
VPSWCPEISRKLLFLIMILIRSIYSIANFSTLVKLKSPPYSLQNVALRDQNMWTETFRLNLAHPAFATFTASSAIRTLPPPPLDMSLHFLKFPLSP